MLLGWEKSHANTIAWPADTEGHAKKCSDIASWRTKQPSNCAKLQLRALLTIDSKKIWNQLENCQKYALKLS